MKRFAQTVKYVSGSAADLNASYAAGQGRHCGAGATQYSA